MQFPRIVLALALISGASAFAPATFGARIRTSMDATIQQTLETLAGPEVAWGSDGVLLGYEESDIKGTTDFKLFAAAAKAAGVDLNSGDYTVLAPCDDAMAGVTLSADQVKYHMIPGRVSKSSIGSDQPTVNGKALHYHRMARQTYMDQAIIGQAPQGAATGMVFPTDVACDNGVIHTIAYVLDPSFVMAGAEAGLGGIA